ncbi:hypothetical protein ROA7450_03917 [Roseovarius albus]|uniref:Rhamnosyl transferase n=2 Tax=Roseovarius albus TaxID=1247867 RepID=A0A1X7A5U4_9RHOB|nr:hypothetical protein ROA7450_03917 [Roseovarius albus]
MQVIGICRFSYPALGGFQVEHETIQQREKYLYDPVRMEDKFRSFEFLTLPPLRAQTDPNFTFLVVIGENMPEIYVERLLDLLADIPQAIVVPRASGPHRKVMCEVVDKVRDGDTLPSLQFRMDDDDAVSVSFVARLRCAAHDLRGLIANKPCTGMDFNQGYIARADRLGLHCEKVVRTLWTPALAIAIKPEVRHCVLSYTHTKLVNRMPVTSFTGEDMFIRGHSDFNDSRQKDGLRTPKLSLLTPEEEARFKEIFNVDTDHIRAQYSCYETTVGTP